MNRSILELPKGIINEERVLISPEYFEKKGRDAPFLQLNLICNVSDVFGIEGATAHLVKLTRNILADREYVEYLDESGVKWYSDFCYKLGRDIVGVFQRASRIPKEIVPPTCNIADDIMLSNISLPQQIVRNNSNLGLIESINGWELMPRNCLERYTLSRDVYYSGTKTLDGKLLDGTMILLPEHEPIPVRKGKPHV